jgi:hypothetical protein
MQTKHVVILTTAVAAFGSIVSGLQSWEELAKPQIAGGLLVLVATQIGAIFTEKPNA